MNEQWRSIESAPKDGTLILGWCVHDADPYFTDNGQRLTIYGSNAEGMAHVDDGVNIIKWEPDLDEGEYIVPAWWHLADGFRETAANPTHWMPLPEPPQETNMKEDQANRYKQLQPIDYSVIDGDNVADAINRGPGAPRRVPKEPTFEDYAELVRQWASDRQIIQNSTAEAQLDGKGREELQECIDACLIGDKWKLKDGIGDTLVVLIIASAIAGIDPTEALALAHNEIKDRRGYLNENGIFIKD